MPTAQGKSHYHKGIGMTWMKSARNFRSNSRKNRPKTCKKMQKSANLRLPILPFGASGSKGRTYAGAGGAPQNGLPKPPKLPLKTHPLPPTHVYASAVPNVTRRESKTRRPLRQDSGQARPAAKWFRIPSSALRFIGPRGTRRRGSRRCGRAGGIRRATGGCRPRWAC